MIDGEVERFIRIAIERENIRKRKESGIEKPWTTDRVFQRSFFCNVYRRLDKTTLWIMDNVVSPNIDDEYLWAMIITSRYFSRIDTLIEMLDHGCFCCSYSIEKRMEIVKNIVLRRMSLGVSVSTGAFITHPATGPWGPTKGHYISELVSALIRDGFDPERASFMNTHRQLTTYEGIGSFMAYQYICDFSYVDRYMANSEDRDTWSAPGPGSMRGMSRLIDGQPVGRIRLDTWLSNTIVLLDKWRSDGRLTGLHLQDVQHWLCEYDKYMRGGSSKRNYPGIGAEKESSWTQ